MVKVRLHPVQPNASHRMGSRTFRESGGLILEEILTTFPETLGLAQTLYFREMGRADFPCAG
jgi:hypothetical protein